jgi:hypothetical protein
MFIPDPNFSIPDPGSKKFRIPDPHQRFLTQNIVYKLSGNMIRDVHRGSRIRIMNFYPSEEELQLNFKWKILDI